MISPRPPSPVRQVKLNISRLAAFNARRRNQVRELSVIRKIDSLLIPLYLFG